MLSPENDLYDSDDDKKIHKPDQKLDKPDVNVQKDQHCKTSGSIFKFKNFLNGKVAKSTVGRKVVKHFLGESGSKLLSSLELATEHTQGKKNSDRMASLLMKFALKGKLLHDERILTQKDVIHLVDPINSLVFDINENLRAQINNNPSGVDVEVLNRGIMRMKAMILELLEPHLSKKAYSSLSWIFDFVGSLSFLTGILSCNKVEKQRLALHQSLEEILAPLRQRLEKGMCRHNKCRQLEVKWDEDKNDEPIPSPPAPSNPLNILRKLIFDPLPTACSCSSNQIKPSKDSSRTRFSFSTAALQEGCGSEHCCFWPLAPSQSQPPSPSYSPISMFDSPLPSDGYRFRQLHMCPQHHIKLHLSLLHRPTVNHFLVHDPDWAGFIGPMEKALPNYIAFYKGAGNYQQARWGMRQIFSEEIWKKYLQVDATHAARGFPRDILERIRDDIQGGVPTPDTYTEAREFVASRMQQAFREGVMPTASYQAYMACLELPDSLYRSIKKRYALKYADYLQKSP